MILFAHNSMLRKFGKRGRKGGSSAAPMRISSRRILDQDALAPKNLDQSIGVVSKQIRDLFGNDIDPPVRGKRIGASSGVGLRDPGVFSSFRRLPALGYLLGCHSVKSQGGWAKGRAIFLRCEPDILACIWRASVLGPPNIIKIPDHWALYFIWGGEGALIFQAGLDCQVTLLGKVAKNGGRPRKAAGRGQLPTSTLERNSYSGQSIMPTTPPAS